ncbi:MAG: Na+/H+ antiporter NhaC family protein [Prevotella sp.]|nr:Na+/H+ antiporter NhaC family protein [Prevotella sp.]MBQ8715423.1 Na+/H+ antiporter NhaC family protein [Prevotella sp.]
MRKGIVALSPLLVFIVLYLVTSIVARDFYKVPITVAFMVASIYAVIISGGIPLRKRIDIYSRGAGTSQMMLMIWIFILAGAFANTAKTMGAINATVNLTLTLLPANMLLAGLFIAACFISISIGTSVGTIVALTPIAAGIASHTGMELPMIVAIVVGGSFFGDNLSFISDTTIVATSTQECRLSDKFRVNSFIVMPVAIIMLIVYLFMGIQTQLSHQVEEVEYLKVIPYLVVLITAILGMNVMAVLTLGMLLSGIIGLCYGAFDIYGWMKAMGDGILSMGELIIITIMAGGLLELIKHNGGIDFIIQRMTRHINSKRGAELSIALLVSLVNICTANNTVAILTVGGIAKKIGDRFGVDNRKCASILDTFSCMMQGIIPYGAQLLMAGGLAAINPISVVPYLYYPFLLGIMSLLAILLRYPKKYS